MTLAWAAPGFVWLGFFLIAPLVFIVLMSFWTPDTSVGFVKDWTTQNYSDLLHPFSLDNAYWKDMWRSFQISAIAVAACLVFGFPVAYFLAMKVEKLQYQIALFILALAPFWTSFITRSVAWAYPLMGRDGALNPSSSELGVSSTTTRCSNTQFSQLSVQLAMIQLYILFMVTPIFFLLSQVDRHAIEAARDLGGNWWSTFREVDPAADHAGRRHRLDLHLRADDGRVRHRAGDQPGGRHHGRASTSRAQIVGTQYPQGAASAVLLVLDPDHGRVRHHPLLEPARGHLMTSSAYAPAMERTQDRVVKRQYKPRRDWAKWGLATYFVIFLIFLYAPMILMAILSFQGYHGRCHVPVQRPGGPRLVALDLREPGPPRAAGHLHELRT